MSADLRLEGLGLTSPPPAQPIGNYRPYRLVGNLLYLSGVGPPHPDGSITTGKVGSELTTEQAYGAAKVCGLNQLVSIIDAVGSLDNVKAMVKVLGMVNAAPTFTEHPKVIDGCTDLYNEVLGEAGLPARSAIGMGSLPRNISVEVETIVELKG